MPDDTESDSTESKAGTPLDESGQASASARPKGPSDAPVTEKPVPSAPPAQQKAAPEKPAPEGKRSFSQYVVTVDNVTGMPAKIEKLSQETGERKELSSNEYAAAYACAAAGAYYAAPPFYSAASIPSSDALIRAYYQGVSDYLKTLAPPE